MPFELPPASSDLPTYIITTPGAVNANSYASVEFADAYFSVSVNSSGWSSLTMLEKEVALITATKRLDTYFAYPGTIYSQYQNLSWPRSGVVDRDGRAISYSLIPIRVMEATCEYAAWLVNNSAEDDLLSLGISRAKIGPLDVTLTQANAPKVVPDFVAELLGLFGDFIGPQDSNGISFSNIWRT